jgi:hypothetical protein
MSWSFLLLRKTRIRLFVTRLERGSEPGEPVVSPVPGGGSGSSARAVHAVEPADDHYTGIDPEKKPLTVEEGNMRGPDSVVSYVVTEDPIK